MASMVKIAGGSVVTAEMRHPVRKPMATAWKVVTQDGKSHCVLNVSIIIITLQKNFQRDMI